MTDANRLDRIEALLEQVAASQQATQQIVESNARSIQALGDRNEETRKIAESAAKSVVALGQTVMDDRAEREEIESQLRLNISSTNSSIQALVTEARENRRQHIDFRERFDRLLAEIQEIWRRIAG